MPSETIRAWQVYREVPRYVLAVSAINALERVAASVGLTSEEFDEDGHVTVGSAPYAHGWFQGDEVIVNPLRNTHRPPR